MINKTNRFLANKIVDKIVKSKASGNLVRCPDINYWTEEEEEKRIEKKMAKRGIPQSLIEWNIKVAEQNQFLKDKQAHEEEIKELNNEIYDLCHNDANDKANLQEKYEQKLKDLKKTIIKIIEIHIDWKNNNDLVEIKEKIEKEFEK